MQPDHIRSIVNQLEYLEESTGLAGRAPGDRFQNDETGHEIVFQNIMFMPQNGGRLDPEELTSAESSVSDVRWLNKKSAKTGGFAVATFTDSEGREYKIGQYLEKVNPNLRSNYIPNKFFGYNLQTKASKKTQEKLKPQDLLTQKIDLSVADIMNQLASSLGTDSPLYSIAHKLALGTPLPYKFPVPEGVSFSGFRDYFCEILQPIALQRGQYTGNAAEAAEKFLGGSFRNTTITFDDSVTAGLSDSILKTPDGKSVLVSTKGGRGATASAKNLFDKIVQLEKSPDGQEFLSGYSEVVDIIKNVVSAGQNGSPLYLGVKYNIISQQDADKVKGLRNSRPVDLTDNAQLKSLQKTLGPRLTELAKNKGTKTPQSTDLYYHLMAAIAELSAEKVNEKTNFSKAAAAILNNGALIQVYTKAREGKTEWTLDEFNTVYPSDNIKGVYLDSRKTYYSTGIKGNFTFKIDKGEGVPSDEPDLSASKPEPDAKAQDLARSKKITSIMRGKPEPEQKVQGAGRAKRR